MKSSKYPILIISLCACYLFYKYVLQIYPSIITDQLMREFDLSATGLGYLAATFYYTYMITQLFVGVLVDKYGTRWLSSGAILCCAIGVIAFSMSHTLLSASLSRGLMGFGVAFATIAYMRLAASWFPPRQYAFISGLLVTAAMAGAVFGQAPLAYLVSILGWRSCLFITGLAGLALTLLFFGFVKDAPASTHHQDVSEAYRLEFKDIVNVLKSKQNWLLTLYNGLAFSPIAIFGGLWGNPFLEQAYQLSKTEVASMISLIFIGLGLGSPIIGMISDYLGKRRNVMLVSTLVGLVAICLILYCHPMPTWLLSTLLFTFGFSLGSFMLVFTIGKELNPLFLTATVISMINTSEPVLNGITEPGIGKLLDLTWDGTIVNGVHVFSLHNYHIALSILPIYLVTASLLLLWVKRD
jgi:sugar phosphate permease